MDLDAATREGEPSAAEAIESDTTEAGEDDPYPLGSFPCTNCQAIVAKGMLFCLRCKAPQSDESSKVTKKFFENKGLRLRLLATAAAGARKPVENLISADFRQLNASSKKRGQMSAEATVIRDAKDRVTRATKLNFSSLASRWTLDEQFQRRMMSEGRCYEDMHRFDFISKACLPDPGRTEEQRVLRAGAHFSSSSQAIAPGKLVYYAHCEVEPLRTLRLTDDCCSVPIGFTYLGAFLPPRLYSTTNVEVREELKHILNDSLVSAETQASIPAAAPTYQGYTQAQWDEWNRSRQGRRYTQAEWDAWLRDLLPAEEGIAQKSRVLLVDGVRMAMSTLKQTQLDKLKEVPLPLPKAQEQIAELESSIRALGGSSEAVEALLEDLSGQVAEAFSREEWYTRWGVHFLPSLLCAHASQQCNNFKDPGVQHYGGDLFADLRDQADEGAGDATNRGHAQGSGKGWRPWKPESTVAVTGITDKLKKTALQASFGEFGRIIRIEVPDGKTVAFVEFEEHRDANDAVKEMHNALVEGRRIGVRMVEDLETKQHRGREDPPDRPRDRSRSQARRPGVSLSEASARASSTQVKTVMQGRCFQNRSGERWRRQRIQTSLRSLPLGPVRRQEAPSRGASTWPNADVNTDYRPEEAFRPVGKAG
ncbi:csx1 [Symbiodinium microadriaticum]|nr:csx1 [Symbiodinium microadriaticum]